MEKLELNEIVGYLPYGLKCEIINYKCDYVGIQYSTVNGYYLLNGEPYFTYEGGSTGKSVKDIRFLLHHLSYLTKEIEVDGEKFVPVIYLAKMRSAYHDSFVIDRAHQALIRDLKILRVPYDMVQKLYSWHFDIHNLIDRKLAIDINKL